LKEAKSCVAESHNNSDSGIEKHIPSRDKSQPETLFSVLRRSNIPDEEKSALRMSQEGLEMFMASFTPGRTMMLGLYYLYTHPDVLEKLRQELDEVNPDPQADLDFQKLNSLPYLVR
jgi:cytochrome P450